MIVLKRLWAFVLTLFWYSALGIVIPVCIWSVFIIMTLATLYALLTSREKLNADVVWTKISKKDINRFRSGMATLLEYVLPGDV